MFDYYYESCYDGIAPLTNAIQYVKSLEFKIISLALVQAAFISSHPDVPSLRCFDFCLAKQRTFSNTNEIVFSLKKKGHKNILMLTSKRCWKLSHDSATLSS